MPAIIPAVIIGAGAVGGALISAHAANNASSAAANAASQNNALQAQIYNSNKALETPFINSGYGAESELNGFLGLLEMRNPRSVVALPPCLTILSPAPERAAQIPTVVVLKARPASLPTQKAYQAKRKAAGTSARTLNKELQALQEGIRSGDRLSGRGRPSDRVCLREGPRSGLLAPTVCRLLSCLA